MSARKVTFKLCPAWTVTVIVSLPSMMTVLSPAAATLGVAAVLENAALPAGAAAWRAVSAKLTVPVLESEQAASANDSASPTSVTFFILPPQQGLDGDGANSRREGGKRCAACGPAVGQAARARRVSDLTYVRDTRQVSLYRIGAMAARYEPGGIMKPSPREQAEAFRQLHTGPRMLVLPNAWDVASARVVEEAGFPAIATTSAGIAWALGYPDGERISRGEMLAAIRRIVAAVRVPVTADVEGGYGATVAAAAETARGVIAAGAVGLNLEDGTNEGTLLDPELQADRIRAVREAAASARVPLVVNARTDAFAVKHWSPAERFTAAVRRANGYLAAGADCLFVPHVSDGEIIGRLASELAGPLNVIAGPPAPALQELERLGVRRASLGPRLVQATLGLVRRLAAELRERGTYDTMTELLIPFGEVQSLVGRTPCRVRTRG